MCNCFAILDKDFARTRKLKIGENIDIGQRNFTIIGIIDSGYDAKIAGAEAFIPLKTAIEMTNRGDIVDMRFIRLKSIAGIDAVKEEIKKILYYENVTITTSNDYISIIAGVSKFIQQLMLVMFFIVILISFLLGISSHHLYKFFEQILGIMRPGRSLGMKLHRKYW